jgi:hypothetical protein
VLSLGDDQIQGKWRVSFTVQTKNIANCIRFLRYASNQALKYRVYDIIRESSPNHGPKMLCELDAPAIVGWLLDNVVSCENC